MSVNDGIPASSQMLWKTAASLPLPHGSPSWHSLWSQYTLWCWPSRWYFEELVISCSQCLRLHSSEGYQWVSWPWLLLSLTLWLVGLVRLATRVRVCPSEETRCMYIHNNRNLYSFQFIIEWNYRGLPGNTYLVPESHWGPPALVPSGTCCSE